MTLVKAVRSCFRNYLRFSGRASRSEFWKFVLFVFLFNIAAIIINSLLFGPDLIERAVTSVGSDGTRTTEIQRTLQYSGGWIAGLFTLACLVPLTAVGWRRLHDSGVAGWWLLVPVVAFVGTILLALTAILGPSELWTALRDTGNVRVSISGGLGALTLLIAIVPNIFLLLRLCRRSDPNPNRYGPPPSEVTP
jgi:uncharacterized membrane protein YhaH (DUF805 family)